MNKRRDLAKALAVDAQRKKRTNRRRTWTKESSLLTYWSCMVFLSTSLALIEFVCRTVSTWKTIQQEGAVRDLSWLSSLCPVARNPQSVLNLMTAWASVLLLLMIGRSTQSQYTDSISMQLQGIRLTEHLCFPLPFHLHQLHSFCNDDSFNYSINEETPIAAESIGWFLYKFFFFIDPSPKGTTCCD